MTPTARCYAGHIGLRLEREATEAAARKRLPADPAHRIAQRDRVGRQRAFDLQRRAVARGPSKASLSGAPVSRSLTPERSPLSAARKSVSAQRARRPARSRQVSWPVAREAVGDRRPGKREFHVGERSIDPLASSRMIDGAAGDADFRERREPLRLGCSARASASISRRPVRAAVGAKRPRWSAAPASRRRSRCGRQQGGKERSRTTSCSAASAGAPVRSSPRLTSSKRTLPVGNSETDTSPRSTGSSPVTCPDLRLHRVAHGVGRDHHRNDHRSGQTRRRAGCNARFQRRLMPVAAGTG